jgi:hypothetical protein
MGVLDFANGTLLDNQATEIMLNSFFQKPELSSLMNIYPNVSIKTQVLYGGRTQKISKKASANCGDFATQSKADIKEKFWEPTLIESGFKLCYKDYQNTVARRFMSPGNQRADLTDTAVGDLNRAIFEDAVAEDILRMAFLSDTGVVLGDLTPGETVDNYDQFNGIWKETKDLVSAIPSKRAYTIPENAEATYSAQYNLASGRASAAMRALLAGDIRAQKGTPKFIMNRALFLNYYYELQDSNKNYTITNIMDGIQMISYDGRDVYGLEFLDRYAKDFRPLFDEVTNPDAPADTPHKLWLVGENGIGASFDTASVPSSLGTEGMWFDRTSQSVYGLSTFMMDAKILDENQILVAY